jgi:hypothetical protein
MLATRQEKQPKRRHSHNLPIRGQIMLPPILHAPRALSEGPQERDMDDAEYVYGGIEQKDKAPDDLQQIVRRLRVLQVVPIFSSGTTEEKVPAMRDDSEKEEAGCG